MFGALANAIQPIPIPEKVTIGYLKVPLIQTKRSKSDETLFLKSGR